VDGIMTPRDVFELVIREGYKVDYARVAITDEQAPLPETLAQILHQVQEARKRGGDLIFNCQMGRGRTTTGMVCACLVATVLNGNHKDLESEEVPLSPPSPFEVLEGVSEEEAYLNGEYKIILQLVGLLSHGKLSKRIADRAINAMEDVQNLRKAVYDYKLKVDATDRRRTPDKYEKLLALGIKYLYRYGMLIVFSNYLVEMRESGQDVGETSFPRWLEERREIETLLGRRSLD